MGILSSRTREKSAFIGVVAVALAARGLFAAAHSTLTGDEVAYARMAQQLVHASPGGLALTQPVLFPIAWAAAHFIVPSWDAAGRMVSLLAVVGLLAAIMALARACFSPRVGLLAGLAVALYPLLVDLGARAMTEPLYDALLVLSAWQGWRALGADDVPSAFGWGVLLGITGQARREGLFFCLLFPPLLLAWEWRRAGPRVALRRSGACLGGVVLATIPVIAMLSTHRHPPRSDFSAARVEAVTGAVTGPLLAPVLLLLLCPARRPGDGRRAVLFGGILAAAFFVMFYPDVARKSTAMVPFVALLGFAGAERWGARLGRAGVAALSVGVLVWLVGQGISAPTRPHFVPPWIDAREDRAAGEWVAARRAPGEGVAGSDVSMSYYADAPQTFVPRADHLADLVAACRREGVRWLILDRRSDCRSRPLLWELALAPADRPGLRLEATFPLRLPRLARLLGGRRVPPDEMAVVYRVNP